MNNKIKIKFSKTDLSPETYKWMLEWVKVIEESKESEKKRKKRLAKLKRILNEKS